MKSNEIKNMVREEFQKIMAELRYGPEGEELAPPTKFLKSKTSPDKKWIVKELPGETSFEHILWVGKTDNSYGNQFFTDQFGKTYDLKINKLPSQIQQMVKDFIEELKHK